MKRASRGNHTDVKNASESKRSYLIDQEGRVPAQAVVGKRASTIHATLARPCWFDLSPDQKGHLLWKPISIDQ